MLLSYNHTIHTCYQIGNETALLFYPDIQFTDINRFCHNSIIVYYSNSKIPVGVVRLSTSIFRSTPTMMP